MLSRTPWLGPRMKFNQLRRRLFITLLGAGAAAPLAARAQQPTMPVIGFLFSNRAATNTHLVAAFLHGLNASGFVEGRNVAIEYRWGEGDPMRLTAMAADLVDRRVAVITAGGPPAARAAKAATSSIPVVFTTGTDPVELGLVASINRPGGNATGVHLLLSGMDTKRLGLLGDLAPRGSVFAALLNPGSHDAPRQAAELQAASRSIGRDMEIMRAGSDNELEAAFAGIARLRPGGLLVASDNWFASRKYLIVTLAARHAILTVYDTRDVVAAGGLMSYGASLTDAYRQAGVYTGKILKGDKPADLPVVQSTKFELIVNLQTAKALGITIPSALLAIADEVIE